MNTVREIAVPSRDPQVLETELGTQRYAALQAAFDQPRWQDRTLWHVNSTAFGGGVAEMLHAAIPFARGLQMRQRWLVISSVPEFFDVTKRLDNGISGLEDASELTSADEAVYAAASSAIASALDDYIAPGDIVVLHDPQTAGLAGRARQLGAMVVWRFHNGNDDPNAHSQQAWDFLEPYLAEVHGLIATLPQFAPPWAFQHPLAVIPPFIDPTSPKNQPLSTERVRSILAHSGLLAATPAAAPTFTLPNGSTDLARLPAEITRYGPAPTPEQPMILQVGRWDPVKDMIGVLRAFRDHLATTTEATLTLAGPEVDGVADDPDAGQEFARCLEFWRTLEPSVRARVQLVCLPMHNPHANAAVVNALQRHATVVVQKSLSEGFGLTLTEAMWKSQAVVASGVGGLRYQLTQQPESIVEDPHDLVTFAGKVRRFLAGSTDRVRSGEHARDRVHREFLLDTHLTSELSFIDSIRNEVFQ
ncbi:glycosyltransferase [Streptomyces bluensis]|uniref:glycosyltransferase n=1 Tax=Streptomyces bluensis TaxID=33897 RepID=UPI003321F37D